MNSIVKSVLIAVVAALLCFIFILITPTGRRLWNNWWHDVQTTDDETNYETKKQVENTCRSMIASYTSDKLVWEQYKDNEDKEKQSWAEQAKMRANKTASSYNNYILENNYVWKENVPKDIVNRLEYIE